MPSGPPVVRPEILMTRLGLASARSGAVVQRVLWETR
jgi:hypothetical protein